MVIIIEKNVDPTLVDPHNIAEDMVEIYNENFDENARFVSAEWLEKSEIRAWKITDIKRELDAATKAACDALGILEEMPKAKSSLKKTTITWWKAHQKRDVERIRIEATCF